MSLLTSFGLNKSTCLSQGLRAMIGPFGIVTLKYQQGYISHPTYLHFTFYSQFPNLEILNKTI